MFSEYQAHLENLDIHHFAQLLQKARKTALSVKPSVIDKPRLEKRNPPQALAVSDGEAAVGVKRKRDNGVEQQELPPIPVEPKSRRSSGTRCHNITKGRLQWQW